MATNENTISAKHMNQYMKELSEYLVKKAEYDRIVAEVAGTLFERRVLSKIKKPIEPVNPVKVNIRRNSLNQDSMLKDGAGSVIFVDAMNGDDNNNDGATPMTALQSCNKALQKATEPDTVVVLMNNDYDKKHD